MMLIAQSKMQMLSGDLPRCTGQPDLFRDSNAVARADANNRQMPVKTFQFAVCDPDIITKPVIITGSDN